MINKEENLRIYYHEQQIYTTQSYLLSLVLSLDLRIGQMVGSDILILDRLMKGWWFELINLGLYALDWAGER